MLKELNPFESNRSLTYEITEFIKNLAKYNEHIVGLSNVGSQLGSTLYDGLYHAQGILGNVPYFLTYTFLQPYPLSVIDAANITTNITNQKDTIQAGGIHELYQKMFDKNYNSNIVNK